MACPYTQTIPYVWRSPSTDSDDHTCDKSETRQKIPDKIARQGLQTLGLKKSIISEAIAVAQQAQGEFEAL